MKRQILLTIISLVSLTGCVKYGTGETIGYIYAVDDGIIWDKVWYKSSLESSESDCYLLRANSKIKEDIKNASGGAKVRLKYSKHMITASLCPEGTGTSDEVTSIELL